MQAILLYKAEKLSVCTFWRGDNSVVAALIEMGLAQNESCVFEDHRVAIFLEVYRTDFIEQVCKRHSQGVN